MVEELARASNDFAFRLAAWLLKEGGGQQKNLLFSPYSIAAALAMVYNGAHGETQNLMAQTLGLENLGLEAANQAHGRLRETLEASQAQIQMAIANSLWGAAGLEFKTDFIQRCQEYFAAEIREIDFCAVEALPTINGWVQDKTQDRIKDLLKPGDLGIWTVLALINAIYFKGIWQNQFDPERTREGNFFLLDGSKKSCPMMFQSGKYAYYRGPDFQAISLPYGDEDYSMYLFLPDAETPFAQFHSQLDASNWSAWMSGFAKREVDVVLPRFKLEYEIELSETLGKIGLQPVLGGQADFSGMCAGGTTISAVRHKAFLQVDEQGSEAAAATAVIMSRGSLHIKPRLVFNRPFFCAICNNQSGIILFMGNVVEPQ